MNLSEPFIRRPVMTILMTISMILFGVLAYQNLPVNDLPAVDYPVIQASVNYPGASPETMASNCATPLEKQFMQIPGLEVVTSESSQGHTSFVLQFAINKSLDGAAIDVQTAITQATAALPVDLPSPPTFTKNNPNDQAILYIGLTSDSMTAGQLYDIASSQVAQQISIVNGVSRVDVYGTKSAIRIKADPSAMAAIGLSVEDLATAYIAPEAMLHILAIEAWWLVNRPKAPALFSDELDAALADFERGLLAGSSYPMNPETKRVLLPRSRYHVYYEVDREAAARGESMLDCSSSQPPSSVTRRVPAHARASSSGDRYCAWVRSGCNKTCDEARNRPRHETLIVVADDDKVHALREALGILQNHVQQGWRVIFKGVAFQD